MAADVLLTFDNALLFHGKDSAVGAEASRLKSWFLRQFEPLAASVKLRTPSTATAVGAPSAAAGAPATLSAVPVAPAPSSSSGSHDWVAPVLSIHNALLSDLYAVLEQLRADPVSVLFRTSVPTSNTRYHDVIKSPMDLAVIKTALGCRSLRNVTELDRCIELIHSNALKVYSGEDEEAKRARQDAAQLREKWRIKIKELAARPPAVDLSGGAVSLVKCNRILTALQLSHANLLLLFVPPVSAIDHPTYISTVKHPLCVKMIYDRLGKGTYASNQAFAEDGEQIWKNCLIFNGPEAPITKSAMVLRAEFRRLFAAEFGVSTLTAHMEMVEEAHRVSEERWKMECEVFFAPDDPDKPRPPVKLPRPITMHQSKSVSASASAAAAGSAASSCSGSEDAAFPASSSLPSLSAADRVECMLSGLGAAVLSGDLALVLHQARQYSVMQHRVTELEATLVLQQQSSVQPTAALESAREQQLQRQVAELEASHCALLARLQQQDHSMEMQIRGIKQEKLDTEEALIQVTQLKRKGEREVDSERKKLRTTQQQLELKDADLAAYHAHLASVADQLSEQRAVTVGLEQEHAELLSLLHKREESAADRLSIVKLEKTDAVEALTQTTQLKRKAEDERDDVHKKLRSTTEELEQKTEQLDQLDCVACMDARASVLYLPCGCAALCVACDAKHQGGPNRAATAGRRSCPMCRADIASTARVRVGH